VIELAGLGPATTKLGLLLRRVLRVLPARRAAGAEPLRRSSRLTVAGERPIPTAIARTPGPGQVQVGDLYLAGGKYRPDGSGRFRGIQPPVACRHLRAVALLTQTVSLAPVNVPPPAINTQNGAYLSISFCFDDLLQHRRSERCCDDRSNSRSSFGTVDGGRWTAEDATRQHGDMARIRCKDWRWRAVHRLMGGGVSRCGCPRWSLPVTDIADVDHGLVRGPLPPPLGGLTVSVGCLVQRHRRAGAP